MLSVGTTAYLQLFIYIMIDMVNTYDDLVMIII